MAGDTMAELGMKLDDIKVELEQLRKQQVESNANLQELLQTFRQLAMHMGVTADPYRPGKANARPPEGFA